MANETAQKARSAIRQKGGPTDQGRRTVNRLPPERRVADILTAARAVFTEKGYDGALISEIAVRAGVVEGSIYRFFENKRDLAFQTVERWYEDLLIRDEAPFQAIKGTWNQLRFIVYQHLYTIRREPALSRLVFHELRPDPRYRETRLFHLNQIYTHRIIDIVKAAAASGEFRSDASGSLARDMIFGAVEHRTWAFLRNEGEFSIEECADGITDLVYRGFLMPSGKQGADDVAERLQRLVAKLESIVTFRSRGC